MSKQNPPPAADATDPSQAVVEREQESGGAFADSTNNADITDNTDDRARPESGVPDETEADAGTPETGTPEVDASRPTPTHPVEAARRVDAERRALMRLRRRRLLLLLSAVPVTVALAVVLGGAWVLAQLLVDVGLIAYCAHLRRAARADQRLRASRAARDRRIAAERAARAAGRTSPSTHAQGRGRADAGAGAGAEEELQGGRQAGPAGQAREDEDDGGEGDDADPAAGRAVDHSYSPIRLSDTIPPTGSMRVLSDAELAIARAETDDQGELMSRVRGRMGRGGRDRGDLDRLDRSGYGEYVEEYDSYGDYGDESGYHDDGAYRDYGGQNADYADYADYGGWDEGTARTSRGRVAPRPPGARPTTSKPGRVQVNPPGTHPDSAAPSPAPGPAPSHAGGEPVPGEGAGGDDDGFTPLMRRRAVGH